MCELLLKHETFMRLRLFFHVLKCELSHVILKTSVGGDNIKKQSNGNLEQKQDVQSIVFVRWIVTGASGMAEAEERWRGSAK